MCFTTAALYTFSKAIEVYVMLTIWRPTIFLFIYLFIFKGNGWKLNCLEGKQLRRKRKEGVEGKTQINTRVYAC